MRPADFRRSSSAAGSPSPLPGVGRAAAATPATVRSASSAAVRRESMIRENMERKRARHAPRPSLCSLLDTCDQNTWLTPREKPFGSWPAAMNVLLAPAPPVTPLENVLFPQSETALSFFTEAY